MTLRCVLAALALAATVAPRPADAQSIQGASGSIGHLANGVEASNGSARIRITALTDSIIRIRIAHGGNFSEDASWAVPAAVRHQGVAVSATTDGFRTNSIAVHLNPNTLQLVMSDLAGRTITADLPEPMRFDRQSFTLRKAMPLKEHFFGMGDKTGLLDRRGYSFTNWNSDTFGYAPSTDPIYKSIP